MQKTLYLATFDVGYMHMLRVIYAADEDEAQQKKGDLEREINAPCKNLEHYPHGFRLVRSTIPGSKSKRHHQGTVSKSVRPITRCRQALPGTLSTIPPYKSANIEYTDRREWTIRES